MTRSARHIECALAEYHTRKEWSRSQLQDVIKNNRGRLLIDWPLLYGRYVAKPPCYPRATKQVFDVGTVAHVAPTPPGGLDSVVAAIPENVLNDQGHRKGAAWKEWSKEHAKLIQMKAEELEPIRHMIRNVWGHSYGRWLMEHAMHLEFTLIYADPVTGLPLRARPDLLAAYQGNVLVVDFKTTRCETPEQFAYDMEEYGYHRQFAWYREAVELFGYTVVGCLALIVDKSPAHLCRVYELPERALSLGQQQNEEHRRELARRLAENDWTDTLGSQVYQVDLPERAYQWKGDSAA